LQSIVRRLAPATPILWCYTYTSGSVDRDAPGAHLHRVLRGMPGAVSIGLGPLSEDDVWHMIRELGKVDAPNGGRRLAARVHEVTAGNPFYVVELLKTLFARSLLAVDPGTGRWIVQPAALNADGDAFALTVHETIAERITCLPDELRAVLITIAVSGRGCGVDTLSDAHGISRLRAVSLCDALAERLLVVEAAERLYQCAHPIVAHVVRHGLSQSRRAEVHRALALSLELVEQREGSGRHVAAIARHAEQAGERAMAYRYALRAFDAACDGHRFDEALSWIGSAADAASTNEEREALNAVKARVVASAGWRETPPIHARVSLPLTRVEEDDLDLPARA
jgi:predicted ATPase